MGGHRQPSKRPTITIDPKLRQAILETELVLKDEELGNHSLPGDDIALEFHKNGYPRLPDCLDRRPKRLLAQAA
jgi:hypothetical protein